MYAFYGWSWSALVFEVVKIVGPWALAAALTLVAIAWPRLERNRLA